MVIPVAAFGIALVALDGSILEADAFYAGLMGVPAADLIGRNVAEFADTRSGYSPTAMIGLLLRTRQPVMTVRDYVRTDGSRTPCEIQLCLLKDAAGEPHSIYVVSQPLTGPLATRSPDPAAPLVDRTDPKS